MRYLKYLAATALTVTAFSASAASAAVVQYTDQSAYAAAAGAQTVQNFNSSALGTTIGTTPVNFGGFSVSTTGTAVINPGNASYQVDGSRYLDVNLAAATLTFTFANAVNSFGANFFSLNNNQARTFVTVGGQTFNPLPLSPSFLGFVSTTPFTSVTFSTPTSGGSNDQFGVDNVTIGGAVPEPATWALMILGMGAVGFAMRRAKRNSDAKFDAKIKRITAGAIA